jgi:hypothetical protein
MARHQDRHWYVLPAPRRMIWKTYQTEISIEVIAFAFDGDAMLYVTVHGTVIEACEVGNA